MQRSTAVGGWEWTGAQSAYPPETSAQAIVEWKMVSPYFNDEPGIRGDTYPWTWAGDGEIYLSSGDPGWGRIHGDGLDIEKITGAPPSYRITKVNEMTGFTGLGGSGPKPTGMICVDGVLYLAVQNLLGSKKPAFGEKSQHGSDAGVFRSTDHGLTWSPEVRTPDPEGVMFPGNRFGGPAFVNFGQNNQGARDGYVYAVSTEQWDNGSHLRIGRVPEDRMMARDAWQFVSGFARGQPQWTGDLEAAASVLTDERRISAPEMVWVAGLRRYLLLTWRLYQDFSGEHGSELMIYESPEPWGPFALVHHEPVWETIEMNPYCPRIPLKWVKPTADGVEGWLLFSGSWARNSRHYRAHVRPFWARRLMA